MAEAISRITPISRRLPDQAIPFRTGTPLKIVFNLVGTVRFWWELCRMTARADLAHADLLKPLAILIVVVGTAAIVWPFYRKFFINEWRERIVSSQPVVFIPDCPAVSAQLKCGDRYTLIPRKNENNQWCIRVRKNQEPEGSESCGLDIDAWDFARSWRYFTVEGVRLYYSW